MLVVMTGEADRCTLIRVGYLKNCTEAAQNKNLLHTDPAYTYNTRRVQAMGVKIAQMMIKA